MVFQEGSAGDVPRTAVRRLLQLLALQLRKIDDLPGLEGRDFSRTLIELLDGAVETLEANEDRDLSQDDLAELRNMVDGLIRHYTDQP